MPRKNHKTRPPARYGDALDEHRELEYYRSVGDIRGYGRLKKKASKATVRKRKRRAQERWRKWKAA